SQKLQDEEFIALCDGLSTFKTLQCLKLSLRHNDQASDQGYNVLGFAFSQLTNLTCLIFELQYNNVNDARTIMISNGLCHLKNLTELNIGLWMNQIGNEGATALGTGLSYLKNLKNLQISLGGNKIQDLVQTSTQSNLFNYCCLIENQQISIINSKNI
ncbi:hypothetical protein ABPG72_021917, partial [Tetrahymena utriculariae]